MPATPLLEECEIEIERLRAWLNRSEYLVRQLQSNNPGLDVFPIIRAIDKAMSPANAVAEFPRRRKGDELAYLGIWP